MEDMGTMRGAVIGTLGAVASLIFAFLPGNQMADSQGKMVASPIEACGLLSSSNYALISRQIVTPTAVTSGVIVIGNGKILDILQGKNEIQNILANSSLTEIIDVGDSVISPGVIDVHVHLNEPGRADWEGFRSGTRAAAAGGITTIIDMPLNSKPVTISAKTLEAKVKSSQGKCAVDVGFWGGLTPENAKNEAQISQLLDRGAVGLKVFLIDSGMEDFQPVNVSDLSVAMRVLTKKNKPLMVHAEVPVGVEIDDESRKQENAVMYYSWLKSRPPTMEREAVRSLITQCKKQGEKCPRVHVAHISDAVTAGMVRGAKLGGMPFSGETCPHYLVFSAEEIQSRATEYKCAPPIRDAVNRESLWNLLKSKEGLELVASDHSPAPFALKRALKGNFLESWGGINGLQYTLPAVWKEASRRGFSLIDMAEILSSRPASLLGISSTKGQIKVGMDADLVIWNPSGPYIEKDFTLETYLRNKLTPYTAGRLQGRVQKAFVRGNLVFDNGVHSVESCGSTLKL